MTDGGIALYLYHIVAHSILHLTSINIMKYLHVNSHFLSWLHHNLINVNFMTCSQLNYPSTGILVIFSNS